ncbi:hypothetical protein [Desulfobacter vibrioformis]|uniref:hypothetical protein n=1 Tax=Desulfobacter vibrioformis TaxID=34031 RepID=UPI0012EB5DFA|nr:hypothetical protein [Desulfobacter vibrioformis]
MAKANRIKALRKKEASRQKTDFLKFINQDEPHFFIATVPGLGSVCLETTNKRRVA